MRVLPKIQAALFSIAAFFLLTSSVAESDRPGIFKNGTHLTWTMYENGKPQGSIESVVAKVFSRNDTLFSESYVKYFDFPLEDPIGYGSFHIQKDSVSFIYEIMNLMPKKLRFDNVEMVRIEGKPLVYPLKPDTGSLHGTKAIIHYVREGEDTNMGYEIVNRKITGHDSLATETGKFDCWIITYEERIDSRLTEPQIRLMTEWYNPEIGIVKQLYFDKKGTKNERILTKIW